MIENHVISLACGDIAVALHCNEAALATALRRRYAAFPAAQAAQLAIEIRVGAVADRGEQIHVRGRTAHSSGPGYSVAIDLERRTAQVVALASHVLGAVEEALRISYIMLAFTGGGLIVHGAGIAFGERGYLFLGPSGAGKTTVARLAPAGSHILNDDLVLLTPQAAGWAIQATPFSNPSQVAPNGPATAQLHRLVHLRQATRHGLHPLRPAIALAAFVAQIPLLSSDPSYSQAIVQRAGSILAAVPSAELHFRPDPGFWPFLLNTDE